MVLFAAAAARADPEPERPPLGRIEGRVLERGSVTDIPVPGAAVATVAGDFAVADAEGRFTLDAPAGAVALTISASGYEPLTLVETFRAGVGIPVEYRLTPRASRDRGRYRTVVRGEARHEGTRF